MRTTDNNGGESIDKFDDLNIENLSAIANKNLMDLQVENPDLLVFPHSFGVYKDDIEKPHIFSLDNENLTTYNLMGFIGRDSTQLTISSRFAKDNKNDFFLHYMLQKVLSINLLEFDQTPNKKNIWDFLLYLFPYYLKKAYSQGIYKTYKKEEYNDANVKGSIDIKRHILKNIPFIGKIAYTTREYSHNNNLTQLIRHTIERIRTHPYGSGILAGDSEVRDIVNKFVFVTNKTYNRNERQKIITSNLKSIAHPYFTEYSALQKICLKILQHEKITFGKEKDKVYGLLFDGAWLWEEYLNKVIQVYGFQHPENRKSSGAIHLIENPKKRYRRYPDFWKENFVLDAKYRNLSTHIDRDSIHQLISYMYILQAKQGGFIYPTNNTNEVECENIGDLSGYGGNVKNWAIPIPQQLENYKVFIEEMKKNEEELTRQLNVIANELQEV